MPHPTKLRVGVLFGGRSSEHEISLRSALTVMSAMDPARYDVLPIAIDRDGRWRLRGDALKLLKQTTPQLGALDRGGTPVTLLPHPDGGALVVEDKALDHRTAGREPERKVDVIFPVLHGTYGEDGTVQGLFELAGIPYVGAGVLGSALGMDKDTQKRLLRDGDLPIVPYFALERSQSQREPALATRLAAELGYPMFVKPNALGSSVGISKVKEPDALAAALDDAFQYDRKVLLEAACEGREVECAVLGNAQPQASVVGEIVLGAGHEFYSYESKYVDPNGAEIRIPADIPAAVAERVRALAVAAFSALSIRGMARVDFFLRRDFSEIFINELNTIPGFTSISMYPKLWEASGLPLPRLIDRLIELALEEHRERASLNYTRRAPT